MIFKPTILFVMIFFFGNFLGAQTNPEAIYKSGNEAYENEDYELAIQKYMELISDDYISADLYYNLGNAYYRTNEIGEAIWAYENATKIDPSHQDVGFNLEFVNNLTVDKISVNKKGIGSWLNKNIFGFTLNLWFYISLLSALIIAYLFYLFFTPTSHLVNNLSLLGITLFGLILIGSTTFSILQKNKITGQSKVVVVEDAAKVLTEPTENATTAFELHEGAQLNIKSKNDDWYEVELNNNTGWIQKKNVWTY